MTIQELIENACCRCMRQAHKHVSDECNAIFNQEGHMLKKCDHCADARADCESVC